MLLRQASRVEPRVGLEFLRGGEKDVLCRMADCVEPEISAEARRVVSSLRLQALRRQMRPGSAVACASMRTFPETYSRQNVVLCAACEAYA